jgi:hypothetical protein
MPVQITCPHCSKTLKASKPPRPETELNCPGCGRSFLTGAPEPLPPPPPPVPPPLPRPERAPGRGRGRPVRGKTSPALLIGVGAGALAVLAGVVVGVVLLSKKGLPNRRGPAAGDQAAWEKRYRELREVRDKAANDADRQDKEAALKAYFDTTLRKAGSLDGWLVFAEGVNRKEIKGIKAPFLEMKSSLRDPSESPYSSWPTIYVTDYDPHTGKPTGLSDVLKQVKPGDVVRISGPVVQFDFGKATSPGKSDYVLHAVAATKVEVVDLKKDRAARLATIDRALADIEKVRELMKAPSGFTIYDVPGPNNIQAYQMAVEWPEYRQAVKEFNKFEPCPPSWLDKTEPLLKAAKPRFESVRLLDVPGEMAPLTPLAERAASHRAATERAVKNLGILRDRWNRYFDEVRAKPEENRRKPTAKEEEEMRAEMESDSKYYVPRAPKKPE